MAASPLRPSRARASASSSRSASASAVAPASSESTKIPASQGPNWSRQYGKSEAAHGTPAAMYSNNLVGSDVV